MSNNPEDNVMTFWEHLEELRARLVRMILAFVVGGGVAWYFKENLLIWLTLPFVQAWNTGPHEGGAALHFPAPASLFICYVRLAAIGGAIFALPIVLYQIWAFIAPGLYSREKRFAVPFVVSSCGLFALGGYFGWRVVFPVAFRYLLHFGGRISPGLDVKPTVMVSDYIDFVTHMLVAFGVAFELPVLAFFLSVAGLVTHKTLIHFFRYFVVVAFIISAVLTPPDPMSQLLLAIPLCGLYGVSIIVAWVFSRKPAEPAT
jgi:sec-independent protein translocase protein TatC